LTEHVERLADHAVQGEMWDKAVAYLRQAGVKSLARSATNRDAALRFEQALAALAHLPANRETLELAIDLRVDLKASVLVFGEFDRIVQHLREAERLATTLSDARRLCQVSVHMCQTLSLAGNPTEAIAFGRKAHALVGSLGDVALEVAANLYLGAACLWTAQFREAEGRLLKVLEVLDGDLSRQRFAHTGFPAATARTYLTQVYANLGRFEEGIVCAEEGIRLAEAVEHPYFILGVSLYLGKLLLARGEYRRALGVLEGVAPLVPQRTMFAFAYAGELGYAYAVSVRLSEGIALLETTLRELETLGHTVGQSTAVVYLGEAYVLADRLGDALTAAQRALTLGRDHGHRNAEANALLLLGKIAARRDSPEEAAGYYRDALALAEELGMRPVVAHCHAGLARLVERGDTPEEARRHRATATTMYDEMGMTYWLEEAAEG
jgi:tetratricopeptide (TPR) repeat protein